MTIPAPAGRWLALLGGVGGLGFPVAVALGASVEAEYLAFLTVVVTIYATGLFAWRKRPDLPIARLLLACGAVLVFGEGLAAVLDGLHESYGPRPGLGPVASLALACHIAGVVLGGAVVALFPTGVAERAHERIAVRASWILVAAVPLQLLAAPRLDVVAEGSGPDETARNPLAIDTLSGLEDVADGLIGLFGVPLLVGVVLLALRYRRLDHVERLQVRWLLLVALTGIVLAQAFWALGDDFEEVGIMVAFVALLALPVTVLVAILRYRLLDVDLFIRRSMVYGVLWTLIAVMYVGTAAALGIAAGERVPAALAVLLAVVATLVFQPLRRRLERLADRWVFGERLGGYELLRRFGTTLGETFDPDELFERLADTVRRGLRVRWARVLVRRAAADGFVLDPQAASGISPGPDAVAELSVPLVHASETLGVIEVGPKEEGELQASDRELLETLAGQAAIAIRNARLASELTVRLAEIHQQTEELRASRARIVGAGDAERRRIERNIHDGAQQELVALIAKLRLTRNQLARDPQHADAMLSELQGDVAQVLDDLRQFASGIHPSVLSDRGLVDAIEARSLRMAVPVDVRAEADVRRARFADEVEGAAYFVVAEALANALKHATADRVEVEIAYRDGALLIEVSDDGSGFEAGLSSGSGLRNMADRVDALGGVLTLSSRSGEGTLVAVRLPAPAREAAHA